MRESYRHILILFFLALGMLACRASKPPLEYKEESFLQTFQDCSADSEDCTKVKMTYPVFTRAPNAQSLKQLNEAVQTLLLRPVTENALPDLDSLARELFQEYGKFIKEFPDAPYHWEVERTIRADPVFPKILTLDAVSYTYLGGAHPNTYEEYVNLDILSGDVITLDQILNPGYHEKLLQIAEQAFRAKQGLGPKEDLDEAGYFFKNAKFALNENFLITKEGLKFLFNPYEVAPYVMGPIDFTVSYESLGDLIRSKGPLGNPSKT